MTDAPRISLEYRPVRIGWVLEAGNFKDFETAASWSACLWGGASNPIIPPDRPDLAENLVQVFGVDVLIPIMPSDAAKAFIDSYPHLRLNRFGDSLFKENRCDFVDIRHAVNRIASDPRERHAARQMTLIRPIWAEGDDLATALRMAADLSVYSL